MVKNKLPETTPAWLGGVIHRMSARRTSGSLPGPAGERLIAPEARSTNGGRRPGRRSARLLAADLSSYAQRAPVARHIRQTPAVARLLHCSSRGGAAPAELVTERAASCSQSTRTGHSQACQRCLTLWLAARVRLPPSTLSAVALAPYPHIG